MKLEYPSKIILAWSEAVKGNKKIRDWLMKNGYPELGIFTFALHNQDESVKWLFDNDHPHLAALAIGASGKVDALTWLRKYNLDILEKVALVADNDEFALHWLVKQGYKEFATLGLQMRLVKNQIDMDNNDPHRISG